MLQLFKRLLSPKKSYSCSEELEEKETNALELKSARFQHCGDHQSSVIFAQDVKKRSEETVAINPFESLNILSQGKLKMKEFTDEQQERKSDSKAQESVLQTRKPGHQSMTWNDAFEDDYSSKKLPEEHFQPEILNNPESSLDGKNKLNTMRTVCNMCISQCHAEDGCDSKSENKQSKGDTKCVKSSDCSKRNESTSGRPTICPQNSSGSSSGDGDKDEDESDEDRRRRRKEEKNDGLTAKDFEEDINEEETRRNQDQWKMMAAEAEKQGALSIMQDLSSKDQLTLAEDQEMQTKDHRAPAKDQEVSATDVEAPVKDQEVSAMDVEAPVRDQEVSAKNQEAPVKDQEVSAKDLEAPVKDQEVSAKDLEAPGKDQQAPAKNHETPTKDLEEPAKNQEVSAKDLEAPGKDLEAPVKDQETLAKDQEVTAKNQEASPKDQEAAAKDKEVSAKSQEAPVKNGKAEAKDQGVLAKKIEKGSYNLVAAFRCHGETSGLIDKCKKCVCYSSHRLLDHSRKCRLRVFGGCKKCKDIRDIYLHHTSHCNSDKCVVTQCWSIKEYLRENNGQCPERWSYKADCIFFGERVIDSKSCDIPQGNETQEPVTTEEIEELLLSLQTPSSSINSTDQNQYSLPGSYFRTRQPGTCQSTYEYRPRRPPDKDKEQSVIYRAQGKAPVSSTSFSIAANEEENETETSQWPSAGIHSRGVSIRIENETAEICEQEAVTGVNIEKNEKSPLRPDNVCSLHPLDEDKLNVKNGQYDENHEWRIVQEENFLGRGAFGVVRLCIDLSSSNLFAAKIIQKDKFDRTELDIWASVSGHSLRCLDLFGAVCVDNRVIMFMEYMEGGSVERMLSFLNENKFNEYSALYILREVLEGLDFLHRRRIIHRDVKGANILVNYALTKVKLADYGEAVQLRHQELYRQENIPPGTENFMAPEVCRSENHSFSSDIWSAACCMYQMLEGQPPWTECSSVIYKVGTTKVPPIFPPCSEAATDLIGQMFRLIPQDRPTAKELLRHCAFEKVNDPPEVPSLNTDEGDDEGGNEGEGEKESSSEEEFFSFDSTEEEGSLDEDNEQLAEHDPSLGITDETEPCAHISSTPALSGPGQHIGLLNQTSPSNDIKAPNGQSTVARRRQGFYVIVPNLLSMVSLDGGDVSDFIGVVGSTAEEEQDDVFDDILISSLS
ncbi:uncharacterized protein LOC116303561, partial [Actinia tenebrosa]|uniref:Uncharacterized protein LOC116303561 n=1 Tax=Actinia tenebrosa TaxID=6105 RepID=A0A6P8IRW2_ACTTE